MATSLYDLSVPTFLQTVRAVGGFLDRAAKHCGETGADPDDFVHARLFDDMAESAITRAGCALGRRIHVFDAPMQ
jgi:hypothetical protein